MEKVQEIQIRSPIPSKTIITLDCTTPPQDQKIELRIRATNLQNSGYELRKSSTPDHLKVPKAFKYPERYRSPTDLMMSPVTKGLLARNRKTGAVLLPPSLNHPKVQDMKMQEVVAFRIDT